MATSYEEPLPGRVRLVGTQAAGQALIGHVEHEAPDGRSEIRRYGWPIALQADAEALRATIRGLHRQWLAALAERPAGGGGAVDRLIGQDL